MTKTSNYQLNQWDASDRVLREDFNSDNAKIDAALGDHEGRVAALESAAAHFGNCLFYTASYTGNGSTTTGQTHTFPKKPMVVMITTPDSGAFNLIFWQGQDRARPVGASSYDVLLSWDGNKAAWKCEQNTYGANVKDTVYQITALLDAEQ